jgi:hypothetical protein
LPHTLASGLQAQGLGPATARHVAQVPPVSILFAAFLGYNPIRHLAGSHVLSSVSAHAQATLTGREFFPHLISAPFRGGLHAAFAFAVLACLVAAVASAMRGGKYHDGELASAQGGSARVIGDPTTGAGQAAAARALSASQGGELI